MTSLKFPDRKNTGSIKHDFMMEKFGVNYPDLIPLWVADMDVAVPDFISDALKERAAHPIFGYTHIDQKSAIKTWQKRHNYNISQKWIVPIPNVVMGLGLAINSFTKENDKVIITPPVYPPFFQIIEGHNRKIAEAPLFKDKSLKYNLDLLSFDKDAKVLILCNPHNPVGRVWKKDELLSVGKFCLENNIIIVSDEIHADFIYPGNVHIPIASLSEEIADITVTLNSASKTFNLSGLSNAYAIIKNPKLRDPFDQFIQKMHLFPNIFGCLATKTAYEQGEQWPSLIMSHIEKNFNRVNDFFKLNMPKVKVIRPEGTYLLWLDFTDYSDSHEKIYSTFLKDAHLAFSCGKEFGSEKYLRMNLGASSTTIIESLDRIKKISHLIS